MRPIDEGMFLLRTYRRLGTAGRLDMVTRIQALALRRLAGHLPAGFDAANVDHCIVAALHVERGDARADVKAAAHLLRACAHAVEAPESFDAESLFDACMQLDAHAAELGQRFKQGRKPGTVSPLRLAVRRILRRTPQATAAGVWAALAARPPKGLSFVDSSRLGRYVETAGKPDTGYRRFATIVSEERPK